MDWNSFFSSVGQSVAGIVGIFAAFIITKIINNQSEFDKKEAHNAELLALTDRINDRINNCKFEWLHNYKIDDISRFIRSQRVDGNRQSAIEFYYSYAFPNTLKRDVALESIQKVLDEDDATASYKQRIAEVSSSRIDTVKKELNEVAREEKEKIESLIIELKHHIRQINHQLSNLENNPESSGLVTFSIIASLILFFLGVIYPFSFLPFNNNVQLELSIWAFFSILFSFKGVILIIPSVIFSVIMIVFLVINRNLKYEISDLEKLKSASKFENYSDYFQVVLDNEKLSNEYYQNT